MCRPSWLCATLASAFAWTLARAENFETTVYAPAGTWTQSLQTLEEIPVPHASKESLLEAFPGNAYASSATNTRLSLFPRGLSPQSVNVYVDGVLMNDHSDPLARYDFSNFESSQLESVSYEASPALSGKSGGSLHFWTRHSAATPRPSVVSHEATFPRGAWTSAFTQQKLLDENQQKLTLSASGARLYDRNHSQADQAGIHEKDSVLMYPLRMSLLYTRPQWRVTSHSFYSFLREHTDAGAGQEDLNAFQKSHQATIALSLSREWSELSQLLVSYQENFVRRFYLDPKDSASDLSFSSDYRSHSRLLRVENPVRFPQPIELTPSLDYLDEDLKILGDEYLGLTHHRRADVGLRGKAALPTGWNVYVFGRSNPASGLSLEKILSGWGALAYLSFSQTVNQPTLYQRYAPSYGFRELKNEKISSTEVGLKSEAFQNFSYHLAAFQSEGREQIEYSLARSRYENISESHIWGILARFGATLGPWQWENSHTYLDTQLLRRSRWSHQFALSNHWSESLVTRLELLWHSSQKDGSATIRATQTLNATIEYQRPTEAWKLWLKAENLLDQRRAFVPGYERSGRSFSLGALHEF